MPLVDMKDMLDHAHSNGYAVGAFDLVNPVFLGGIIRACERARAPVILSLAESHFPRFDFDLAMAATERAAGHADVPVAIHLDHGASFESAVRAINLGCNSVMVDTSHDTFPTNMARTRRVVEMAHGCGVTVEGKLGCIARVEGEEAWTPTGDVVYTSVEEACAYVEHTQVDCLAVSIDNTVQGRSRGRPRLDFDRLGQINESLHIPLVIPGSTGLSDEQYRRLIENGAAKINNYTALADAAAGALREAAARDVRASYTDLVKGVRTAIQTEVERIIHLLGSAGRAEEILAIARPWRKVEHLIVYNINSASDAEVKAMMARGREVLCKIPGVRRVASGHAIKEHARYRCCWIIEFANVNVIDSYRDHPDHVAFANGFFRPITPDRVSIDYELTE